MARRSTTATWCAASRGVARGLEAGEFRREEHRHPSAAIVAAEDGSAAEQSSADKPRVPVLSQTSTGNRRHVRAIRRQQTRIVGMILVDFARARHNDKRGGGAPKVSFDEALTISTRRGQNLVALDDALVALEAAHPRKSQVVDLRFFAGLSLEETADALHVSIDTVKRGLALRETVAVAGAQRRALSDCGRLSIALKTPDRHIRCIDIKMSA